MRGCLISAIALLTSAGISVAQPALSLELSEEDLAPTGPGMFLADNLTPPASGGLPVVDLTNAEPVFGNLRRLVAAGVAQGFDGIVYENRDRGHSRLRYSEFPALTWLTYSDALKRGGLDYGLAGSVFTNLVTFGNSSTAITRGTAKRSLARAAMTQNGLAARMFESYLRNQIFVYPEHRDHDDADYFPANWPYTIISQGSSGSDREFLKAIALTLASFQPETFQALRDSGLVAPTVQMILRRELASVVRPEHYFTARAHPVVFRGSNLRPGRMVARASSLREEAIPPMVRIRVESESFSNAAGLAGLSEKLFDTPSAVARIWRDTAGRKSMTVTAAGTEDPNGRALTFSWFVLSGEEDRIRIEPLDAAGTRTRIEFDWQQPKILRGQLSKGKGRLRSRVDIGVFADNGLEVSAPAFISVDIPEHQERSYEMVGEDAPILISIDYDAIGRGAYYDPLLFWSAPWTDRINGTTRERRLADGSWQPVPDGGYEIDRSNPVKPVLVHRN